MQMNRVIAIDPSKVLLWAAMQLHDARVVCFAVHTVPSMLDGFFRLWKSHGKQVVVYEDCYAHKNKRTYGDLYHTRERAREAAIKNGFQFEVCAPTKWQVPMLFLPGESSRAVKREQAKTRSMAVASAYMRYPVTSPDAADAICLLLHRCSVPCTYAAIKKGSWDA